MRTILDFALQRALRVFLPAMVFATAPDSIAAQTSAERQRRVDWLQANAAPIRSLDPADDNFDDLAPLGAAIGNARVVMLGEQSHGARAHNVSGGW